MSDKIEITRKGKIGDLDVNFKLTFDPSIAGYGAGNDRWKQNKIVINAGTCPSPTDLGLPGIPEGPNSDDGGPIDQAWKVYNKNEKKIHKLLMAEFKDEITAIIAEHSNYDYADLKVLFNKYAGCSMCPCSPGWNVKKGTRNAVWKERGVNGWIWISAETDEELKGHEKSRRVSAVNSAKYRIDEATKQLNELEEKKESLEKKLIKLRIKRADAYKELQPGDIKEKE